MAEPGGRRIDPGSTLQERNPAEVKGHDLEQDTRNGIVHVRVTDDVAETGTVTPERRARKGVVMSLSVLSLKERHRASHGGDGEGCNESNERSNDLTCMVKKR